MAAADPEQIENIVIVGSGPAGYTAAIYAARANLQPLLITGFQRGGIPGGQLMTTTHVENYPGFPDGVLGPDLMDLMKSQATRWGTQLIEADADAIDLTQRPFRITTEGRTIHAHAVVIATGASANRLGLPSEQTFWSSGISACAICDGATPQFRNEELAVVGAEHKIEPPVPIHVAQRGRAVATGAGSVDAVERVRALLRYPHVLGRRGCALVAVVEERA